MGEAPNKMTPFMTTVCTVQRSKRDSLSATTHVDGTARAQSVCKKNAPLFYELIDAVHTHTGQPVVLNTSLNGRGEPIVETEVDALAFFSTHPIDALLIEDVLITKE